MSFWPSVFENISSQNKILEYRRTFPKDCKYAYMYISKPTKSICGIIEFGKKFSLEDWSIEYQHLDEVIERINNYNPSYKYAMEILSFQEIKPISLENLRINVPNFVAPQSYLLLDNKPTLMEYILNNTIYVGAKKENSFDNVYPEHICKRY